MEIIPGRKSLENPVFSTGLWMLIFQRQALPFLVVRPAFSAPQLAAIPPPKQEQTLKIPVFSTWYIYIHKMSVHLHA